MVLRRHSRVVFSLDDAIYAGHRDTPNKKYPFVYKLKYGPGVNEVLAKSAHVIAGSRTLAEHARQFNPHVSVVPTVVDANRYAYRAPTASSECLTIGWMGTRSTSPYVFDIAPKKMEKGQRYFQGRVWVDDKDLQIVKTRGKATGLLKKKEDQAFPTFETFRENIEGHFWFPTYTRADDVLHFKTGPDVRIRVSVKYTNYKRFGSTIKIGKPTEVDPEKP